MELCGLVPVTERLPDDSIAGSDKKFIVISRDKTVHQAKYFGEGLWDVQVAPRQTQRILAKDFVVQWLDQDSKLVMEPDYDWSAIGQAIYDAEPFMVVSFKAADNV